MDDFLYNLRHNMDRRHTSVDRKPGSRRRKDPHVKSSFWEYMNESVGTSLSQIQVHLASIAECQGHLAEAQALHASAELRKANALEEIARDFKKVIDSDKANKHTVKKFKTAKFNASVPAAEGE